MPKVEVSTTVDADLLARARKVCAGRTDASLLEAALEALLREHPSAGIDAAYLRAYREASVDEPDVWGDVAAFADAAAKRAHSSA